MRPYVAGEREPEEENCPRGSFQTGVVYEMTRDGRLGRALRRQVAELEAEEFLTEEEANAPLPPQIAESLQEAHESNVARQTAQAQADARRADGISDAAIAASQPVELFVLRVGRHYIPLNRARVRPEEHVFVKDANGNYESIGICDSCGEPPDPPVIIT